MKLQELQKSIIDWSIEKNIYNPENQYLKCCEEIGETAGAILKGNREDILNEIGDIGVTVIIYYHLIEWDIEWELEREMYFSDRQLIKFITEGINDGLDDILQDVHNLAQNHDSTLEECLTLAWNKIKGRTGRTVGGTFIKD